MLYIVAIQKTRECVNLAISVRGRKGKPMSDLIEPTGGCITCAKCEKVRLSHFCGRRKLTDKQLYNTKGYCSKYVPKEKKIRGSE